MKKIIICAALFLSAALYKDAAAQVRVHVNFNIGSQPVWGPVGYDYAQYYYLPDIESYYYVPTHQFIYMSDGRWIYSYSLPPRYRGYDLYSGYKVVMNEPRPYNHFYQDRVRYSGYRGNRSQTIIRNSDDRRYWQIKGHPRYNEYQQNNGRGHGNDNDQGNHGNGNGNGNGRDRGHGHGHGHD